MNEQVVAKAEKQQGQPVESPSTDFKQIRAVFRNINQDPSLANAKLFFEETYWGELGHGSDDIRVNTYESHRWNLVVDETVVKSWTISAVDGYDQVFNI